MVYFVYIITNQMHGTIYIGFTNNLARRMHEHREGAIKGFSRKYKLKRLVYFEVFEDIHIGQQRERTLKHWNRAWKIALIEKENPNWNDLFDLLAP